MTTDASVYRIVTDIHTANKDLLGQINEWSSIADVMYDALRSAINSDAIPPHANECTCKLCTAINEYKVLKWKMTQ